MYLLLLPILVYPLKMLLPTSLTNIYTFHMPYLHIMTLCVKLGIEAVYTMYQKKVVAPQQKLSGLLSSTFSYLERAPRELHVLLYSA
jgi:hypothetical protein